MAITGTFYDMLRDFETVTNNTISGKCSNCGECCSDFLPISDQDIKRIHRYIKANNVKEKHANIVVQSGIDFTCPFRDNINKVCTIYDVRPSICREFKCDYTVEKISSKKDFFNHKYAIVSMRQEFFGEGKGKNILPILYQFMGIYQGELRKRRESK